MFRNCCRFDSFPCRLLVAENLIVLIGGGRNWLVSTALIAKSSGVRPRYLEKGWSDL